MLQRSDDIFSKIWKTAHGEQQDGLIVLIVFFLLSSILNIVICKKSNKLLLSWHKFRFCFPTPKDGEWSHSQKGAEIFGNLRK